MVLAILVIVAHLALGLGTFWSVVAIAGYGIGVALTPGRRSAALPSTDRPALDGPTDLAVQLRRNALRLRSANLPDGVRTSMGRLENSLETVLGDWDDLVDYPEHQVTIRSIIGDYIPALSSAYLDVPDIAHPRAVRDIISSLDLLADETARIHAAVLEDNLNRLEDQSRVLRMQFGQLPHPDSDQG